VWPGSICAWMRQRPSSGSRTRVSVSAYQTTTTPRLPSTDESNHSVFLLLLLLLSMFPILRVLVLVVTEGLVLGGYSLSFTCSHLGRKATEDSSRLPRKPSLLVRPVAPHWPRRGPYESPRSTAPVSVRSRCSPFSTTGPILVGYAAGLTAFRSPLKRSMANAGLQDPALPTIKMGDSK
jgi:hypothetical protein